MDEKNLGSHKEWLDEKSLAIKVAVLALPLALLGAVGAVFTNATYTNSQTVKVAQVT